MILERCVLSITPGQEEGFERAWQEAQAIFAEQPGCLGARVLSGVESPSTYLLLVEWESLEAHTEGFRGSDAFTAWRELAGPFFAAPPQVEHFAPVE